MTPRRRYAWVTAVLAIPVGAAAQQAVPPAERAAVVAWAECQDYCRANLDSVLAIAARRSPTLVPFLRSLLLAGPPPARRDSLRRELQAARARDDTVLAPLQQDSLRPPGVAAPTPPPPDSLMVLQWLDVLDRTYRMRSALALGWIGTEPARAALDSALLLRLDPRVRRTVQFARDSLPR